MAGTFLSIFKGTGLAASSTCNEDTIDDCYGVMTFSWRMGEDYDGAAS
jgi:hypothetical protein